MDSVFLPSDAELASALSVLKEQIEADSLLKSAAFDDSMLKRALWAKHNDVKVARKLLVALASWRLKHLGSASAPMSIAQVHPFLLTGILQVRLRSLSKLHLFLMQFPHYPSPHACMVWSVS